MKSIEYDAQLLKKYLLGETTPEELQEVKLLLQRYPNLPNDLEELRKKARTGELFNHLHHYSTVNAYQRFLRQRTVISAPLRKSYKLRRWQFSAAAAALIFIVALSIWLIQPITFSSTATAVLQPGIDKAELQLSNGQKINIQQQQLHLQLGNVQVTYKKGVLHYQVTSDTITTPAKTVKQNNRELSTHATHPDQLSVVSHTPSMENKLIVPRGAENKVILADGTIVHLNAASELTYPIQFQGKERQVKLQGEAYFEVKHDPSHPFIVNTPFGKVEVLGTSFNVNAYSDHSACRTTLVKGKVQIITPDQQKLELVPGEQALFSATTLSKKQVDITNEVSWTSGIYTFQQESLSDIMERLKRWYKIDQIIYDNPGIGQLRYTGNIQRNININQFLDAFQLTGDFSYHINENTIYLHQKKKR